MDTQFLTDPKIEELGEKYGPAGPLVIASLLGQAALQGRGGRVERTFRAIASETFTKAGEVASIIGTAIDSEVLVAERRDERSFVARFPAWERWQAAGRKAQSRARKNPPLAGNVTECHEESQKVTNKTRQDKTRQDKTRQKENVADRADAPLCHLLADLIEENGSLRPRIGKGWVEAERLLLTRDKRNPMEAESLIRWCQRDDFWHVNVLSMPKFREKYDRLLLTAKQQGQKSRSPGMAQAQRFADTAARLANDQS